MVVIHGLTACDACRKARKALESKGFDVTFRDVRDNPLSPAEIEKFLEFFGQELVNTRSATWRQLDEAERGIAPAELIRRHPTVMKRPVVEGTRVTLGWSAATEALHLG